MSRLYLAHGVAPHLHRRRRTWWRLTGILAGIVEFFLPVFGVVSLLLMVLGILAFVWCLDQLLRMVLP